MTCKVETIDADMPVAEVLPAYFGEKQMHRAFPVTRDGALVGMIERDGLIARSADQSVRVMSDLFGVNTPIMALPGETCRIVSNRLAVHRLERLPVVSDAQSASPGGPDKPERPREAVACLLRGRGTARVVSGALPLYHLRQRLAVPTKREDKAAGERP